MPPSGVGLPQRVDVLASALHPRKDPHIQRGKVNFYDFHRQTFDINRLDAGEQDDLVIHTPKALENGQAVENDRLTALAIFKLVRVVVELPNDFERLVPTAQQQASG